MFCHVKNISYICGGFWCYYEPTKIQNGIIYGSIKKNIFTMIKKTFLIAALMLCGIGAMAQYNIARQRGSKGTTSDWVQTSAVFLFIRIIVKRLQRMVG